MAWFEFAGKTYADEEKDAGAGTELVEGLSPGSVCVTVVGGHQDTTLGWLRQCERAECMTPAEQLPVTTGPWTHPGCSCCTQHPPVHLCTIPVPTTVYPCPLTLFTGAGKGVAMAWPNPTSAGDLLNPHLSHDSGTAPLQLRAGLAEWGVG